MRSLHREIASRTARRAWLVAWLLALATCLAARASSAQSRTPSWPLAEAIPWGYVGYGGGQVPRWRADDPDLVRAGLHERPEEALAERSQVLRSEAIDLDGDGVDERVVEVAPCDDPAPQNMYPGVVLLRRGALGWSAAVLGRLIEHQPDGRRRDWDIDWIGLEWARVRDAGRWRLAMLYTVLVTEEHQSGESYPHHLGLRLRMVDGEVRADGFCRRDDGEADARGWRGVAPECRCRADASWRTVDRDWPRCAASICGRALYPEARAGHFWSSRETPPPAWCRALVADARRRAPPAR